MFFSIIIPVYNPAELIRPLFDSLMTNYCTDDIEIVIADDISTESYDEVLESYPLLHFKVISNDKHYGLPRWGRENGMNAASGEWICFADQDDYFEDHVFDIIKQRIQRDGLKNYIETEIYVEHVLEDHLKQLIPIQRNMTHGKFYERSFLIENNIHYDEVRSGEDVNFQTKVITTLFNIGGSVSFVDTPTYTWIQRPNSLSKTEQGSNSIQFFFQYYTDYVRGQCGYYISNMKERQEQNLPVNLKYYQDQIEYFFIFSYCYLSAMEHPEYNFDPEAKQKNYDLTKKYYDEYLSLFNMTTEEYLNKVYSEYLEAYTNIYSVCAHQYNFIPRYSFYDWVHKYLD